MTFSSLPVADVALIHQNRQMPRPHRICQMVSAQLLGLVATGCTDSEQQRNIIVDTAPFSTVSLPYIAGSEGAIIAIVEDFSQDNGMGFLGGPGHPTLPADQFHVTVAGHGLNLSATRLPTTLPDIEVSAIAVAQPSDRDKARAAEFVCRLKQVQRIAC